MRPPLEDLNNSIPVARGFRSRLIGLGRRPAPGTRLAIRTRSVHTFGMSSPIAVAALDEFGRVIESRTLPPNRLYFHRRARWIGEWAQPEPPAIGSRWEVS